MKTKQAIWKTYWSVVLIGIFTLCVIVLYGAAGEANARFVVADNLDLFQAQYQMLKNTGTFFAQDVPAPFLHGVTRNDLPSEWSLATVLYMVLPGYAAYIANYLVKVLLAVVSFVLLAGELHRRNLLGNAGAEVAREAGLYMNEETHALQPWRGTPSWNLAVLGGFSYGLLNLFPAFGISFSSIPLWIWILLRLDRAKGWKEALLWYVLLFVYPFVSYFSYFGLFLLAYMCVAWLWSSIKRRKPNHRLLIAILVLSLGCMAFEYRIFQSMLFSKEVTIRDSMVVASLDLQGVWLQIREALLNGATMHTKSVHTLVVLPVCVIYLLVCNIGYIRQGRPKMILKDLYNLGALILLFNAVIYGLYYWEPFRNLVEALVPPLKGWQFNRTVFFNPFLWYGLFFVALYRLLRLAAGRIEAYQTFGVGDDKTVRRAKGETVIAFLLMYAAIAVVLGTSTPDNDLYSTAHALAYRVVKGTQQDSLSYGELYSTDLFEKAKEDIGYDHEWSVAYGFYPAILEYNDIYTLDGYLGFYSQEYKDAFRKAIAPAFALQPQNGRYFDDWGARCYLYSGTEGTNVEPVRNYQHMEEPIYIDAKALKDLDCRYIFSRPDLTNAEEMGLTLVGTYTDENSPYILHVYELQ